MATTSIILARIMFAAFTMDKLADQVITFCAQRLNNEVVDNHSRLQRARDTISQLPTSCFSSYKNLVNKTHERRPLLTHTSHNLFSQKTINSVVDNDYGALDEESNTERMQRTSRRICGIM